MRRPAAQPSRGDGERAPDDEDRAGEGEDRRGRGGRLGTFEVKPLLSCQRQRHTAGHGDPAEDPSAPAARAGWRRPPIAHRIASGTRAGRMYCARLEADSVKKTSMVAATRAAKRTACASRVASRRQPEQLG